MMPYPTYSLRAVLAATLLLASSWASATDSTTVSKEALEQCLSAPQMPEEKLVCVEKLVHPQEVAKASKTVEREAKHVLLQRHQEPSYLTVSSGVRLKSDTSTSNAIYEAQLIKNISITDGDKTNSEHDFWIDLPVRFNLRQLTEPSKPVRTPSFNPGLRLIWSPSKNWFNSAGLYHYSNGQEGDSVVNGEINLRDGSFNTNYAELSIGHINAGEQLNAKNTLWKQFTWRHHFYGTFETGQRDQYPHDQVIASFHKTLTGFPNPFLDRNLDEVQLRLTTTLGLGYHYRNANASPPVEAKFTDRLSTRLEFITIPKATDKFGFYLRHDYGFDYYNINFQRRINRFQIGVVTLTP